MNLYRTDLECALCALQFVQTSARETEIRERHGAVAEELSRELMKLERETSWTADEMCARHAELVELLMHERPLIAAAFESCRQAWDELDRVISSRYELPEDRKTKKLAKPDKPRKPSVYAVERGNAHTVVLRISEAAGFLDLFVGSLTHAHA